MPESDLSSSVELSADQFQQLLDTISDRPTDFKLQKEQFDQLLQALDRTEETQVSTTQSATELEALNRTNEILSFELLAIGILIGIIVIFFFRRKF